MSRRGYTLVELLLVLAILVVLAAAAAPLPRSLKDAVELLRRSQRARELLGEGFVDHFVRTRDWEVRQFERAVTTWELERYLEII